MSEERRPVRDLCGSCVYAADCAARSRSDVPVVCCDRYLALGAKADDAAAAYKPPVVPNAKSQASGLCGTCANRDKCKRRYVEGGVWRCADYR